MKLIIPTLLACALCFLGLDRAGFFANDDDGRSSSANASQTITLSKDKVSKQLTDITSILKQAKVTPNYSQTDSKINGFKIVSLESTGFWKDVALEANDIILEIDGTQLDSPQAAMSLYQKIKDFQTIDLKIKRGGEVKNIQYRIE